MSLKKVFKAWDGLISSLALGCHGWKLKPLGNIILRLKMLFFPGVWELPTILMAQQLYNRLQTWLCFGEWWGKNMQGSSLFGAILMFREWVQ